MITSPKWNTNPIFWAFSLLWWVLWVAAFYCDNLYFFFGGIACIGAANVQGYDAWKNRRI
jgi:TM2 domain-containing membrane protein YozV